MNSHLPALRLSFLSAAAAALVALTLASCSPRGSSQITAGDRYFAAGEYDKAEIEYKNALQAKKMQDTHAIGRLGIIYYEQGRLRQAVPFLLRARELETKDLGVRSKVAMVYIMTGKSKEARAEAEYILGQNPSDEIAPLLLAQASSKTPEDMTSAEQRLKSLTGDASNGAPALTALGAIELGRKNFDAAETLLHRAISLNPKFAAAHSAIASVHLARNDRSSAETALKSAAQLSPNRSNASVQYARFKIQTGDVSTARKVMEDVVKETPDYLPAQSLLAEIAALEKRYDDSAALAAKVLAIDAAQPEAALLSARLKLSRGDPGKAAEELESFLKFYPNSPQALYYLGLAYSALGEKIKAIDRLTQAIKIAQMPEAILALAGVNLRNGDAAAVIAGLKPFVDKHPDNMPARMMLASAHRAQGDHDVALEIYQRSAKDFPNDPLSVFETGLALLRQKKTSDASAAFHEALRRNPGFTPALEQLVGIHLSAKEPDAALRLIEAEKQRDPKSATGFLLAGRVYDSMGDSVRAEAEFKKAIELRPEIPTAYFQLTRLYISSGQQEKALASLKSVTDRNPKDATAMLITGLIHNEQDDFQGARDAYEKVLAINPKSTVALNNLAYLYSEKLGDLDKALDLAQKARELLPDEPHTADTLGWVLYKKKQYARAASLLEESAAAIPQSAEVQYHLGLSRYMLGMQKTAEEALSRALELNSTFTSAPEIRRRLEVLRLTDKTPAPEAIATLELSLKEYPDDAVAYSGLAAVHERMQAPDRAIAMYQSAVEANPASLDAWVGLARLHSAQGHSAKALEAAKTARKIAPDDADIAWPLGVAVYKAGDANWAASLLQEAARKQPDEPELLYSAAQALYAVGQVDASQNMVTRALEKYASAANGKTTPSGTTDAKTLLRMIELANKPDVSAAAEIDVALSRDPKNAAALMAKGRLEEVTGEPERAFKTYESVLIAVPTFFPVKLRLAALSSSQGTPDKRSLEWAQQARNAYPNNAEAAKYLAVLTFRHGDATRAVGLLKQAAMGNPKDAEILYYLGRAQLETNEIAPGRESLNKAIALNLRADLAAEAAKILKEK